MNALGAGDGNSIINEPEHIVNLPMSILNWFLKAMPTPTDQNRSVQLGVHYEEFGEMARALGDNLTADELEQVASFYKSDSRYLTSRTGIDRKEFLDALIDQIVTALGVGYTQGFDMIGALEAVNAANWAKFVNGEPQWTEQGKIAKPTGWCKPDMTPFLGNTGHPDFDDIRENDHLLYAQALTFRHLRDVNVSRCLKWHPAGLNSWSLSDWFTALGGEFGELGGELKMLNRERDGLPGNKREATLENVGKEAADVVFYLDLLCAAAGIDLEVAIRQKFNEVSERVGFPERL